MRIVQQLRLISFGSRLVRACLVVAPAIGVASASSLFAQSPASPFDRNLRIAEEAPGYGGFFRDRDTGVYFVYSSIEENDEAVLAAWRRHVGGDAGAFVLRGNYEFQRLFVWYTEIAREAWRLLSIHGFLDEANQIFFGVDDEEMLRQFWQVVDALGVPRDAIRAGVAPIGWGG